MSHRDEIRRAANMLEAADELGTPGPWHHGRDYGSLVADHPHPDRPNPAAGGWAWEDAYGGCLVGESIMLADRLLIAHVRNAAMHLPALLRALADEDPHAASRAAVELSRTLIENVQYVPNVSSASDTTTSPTSDTFPCGQPPNVSPTTSLTTSLTTSPPSDTTP